MKTSFSCNWNKAYTPCFTFVHLIFQLLVELSFPRARSTVTLPLPTFLGVDNCHLSLFPAKSAFNDGQFCHRKPDVWNSHSRGSRKLRQKTNGENNGEPYQTWKALERGYLWCDEWFNEWWEGGKILLKIQYQYAMLIFVRVELRIHLFVDHSLFGHVDCVAGCSVFSSVSPKLDKFWGWTARPIRADNELRSFSASAYVENVGFH